MLAYIFKIRIWSVDIIGVHLHYKKRHTVQGMSDKVSVILRFMAPVAGPLILTGFRLKRSSSDGGYIEVILMVGGSHLAQDAGVVGGLEGARGRRQQARLQAQVRRPVQLLPQRRHTVAPQGWGL